MRWSLGHGCDLQVGMGRRPVWVGPGRRMIFQKTFLSTSRQLLPSSRSGLFLADGLPGVVRKLRSHHWVHESIPAGGKAGPAYRPRKKAEPQLESNAWIWEATCYLAHNRKLLFMTMLIQRSTHFSLCFTQWFSLNTSCKQRENETKACWLQRLIPSNCTTSSHTEWVPEAIRIVFVW